ncbi:hypothetical protein RB195_006459 [Necator americanus]|uniref:Uncharacterized protein n=1 Tax=Necator americanus TaxID=51031 RepID=A0ABR1BSR2_NECAM
MNGEAALEQLQQPATSRADRAKAPIPSGLSSAGSLALQAKAPASKTSPTLSKTPPFSTLFDALTLSETILRLTPETDGTRV